MPVGEMLRRMTSRELTEWMAFYELEPFGEERGDLRAGIVASTIANVNRDPKKQKKAFTPQDFLPDFGRRKAGGKGVPKTPEQLKAKFSRIAAALRKKG